MVGILKKILVLHPNLVGWITFYHSRVCYIQWTGLREHLNRKPTGNLHFFPLNLGLSDMFSVKPIHWYTSHHARILFFSGPSSKLTSYGTSPCLVKHRTKCALASIPICSMYGIFTYIWVIIRANVGKYTIHGAYGIANCYIVYQTVPARNTNYKWWNHWLFPWDYTFHTIF